MAAQEEIREHYTYTKQLNSSAFHKQISNFLSLSYDYGVHHLFMKKQKNDIYWMKYLDMTPPVRYAPQYSTMQVRGA